MPGASCNSVGAYFHMLAGDTEAIKSFISVMGAICQREENSQIRFAIRPNSEGLCGAAHRILYNLFGVRGLVGNSSIGFTLAEQVQN